MKTFKEFLAESVLIRVPATPEHISKALDDKDVDVRWYATRRVKEHTNK